MERKVTPLLVVEWILRLGIAGVFLYAGALKAWRPDLFFTDIENFRLLAGAPAAALAYFLPWIEIAAGAAVLAGRQFRGGVLILMALTAAFAAALALAWARGLDISCGCFGQAAEEVDFPRSLARNGTILVALGGLLFLDAWKTARR